ncbi:stalk domain-containing protein [Moorella sulfitireducens]|uniref:stalk domain-containing protein n=1 Tax=Neomoorella sulfitireducens TaxID=2972948 RepID=UPI0021AC3069|nr:stalk domain-containing protein [Moorella sulfitireducens]
MSNIQPLEGVVEAMLLKKMAKAVLCLGLLGMITAPAVAGAATPVKIYVDYKEVKIPPGDQGAYIDGGRTYVPLRVVAENLGALVEWRQDTRQVIITTKGNSSYAVPGRTARNTTDIEIVINGAALHIPISYGKPRITAAGRTVIPLRVVGEALGCEVNWVDSTRVVEIKSPAYKLLEDLAAFRSNLRLLDGRVVNSAELPAMGEEAFSTAQMQEFQKFRELLSKYDHEIKLPDGSIIKMADVTIMGKAVATADQLKSWLAKETPRIAEKMRREYGREMIPIPDLAELYIRIGAEYGVRGDLAFAQAIKETGYFQFTGSVKPMQNNYCGLWATGQPLTGQESLNGADPSGVSLQPGLHGATFASPEIGVEAHIQHLYAYATKAPLPPGKTLYDPRFNLVQRGSAQKWVELNARWAVPGTTYGQSIIQDYWLKALL